MPVAGCTLMRSKRFLGSKVPKPGTAIESISQAESPITCESELSIDADVSLSTLHLSLKISIMPFVSIVIINNCKISEKIPISQKKMLQINFNIKKNLALNIIKIERDLLKEGSLFAI